MTNLAIPYARHISGRNIGPDQKQDGIGRRANVSCFGCNESLEHRRKSRDGRRRAHYAHLRGSIADVKECVETAIHIRIKDMLADISDTTLELPQWHDTCIQFLPIWGATEVAIGVGNRKADVVLHNSLGQRLAIEVWFSNRKTNEAIVDYREAGLPTVEFRVSEDDTNASVGDLVERLQVSEWIVEPFEPFESASAPNSHLPKIYLASKARVIRRTNTIDIVVARINRERRTTPLFRRWTEGKTSSMYPKTQRQVFANAIILTELGFLQHNRAKPWLFRYHIAHGNFLYADLGGSEVIPIYEDTAAMLYAPDLREDLEVEEYAIHRFAERLQNEGVDVRTGFEAPYHIERKDMNPVRFVDRAMLNKLIAWEAS